MEEENNKKKQASIGKKNRRRGHAEETRAVRKLKEITKDDALCTSRSESKNLDDKKIDIADPNNILPFYCQIKATQQMPQVKKLNAEVGLKDKPLAILWNAQEMKDKKQVSVGRYWIIPEDLFYNLLTKYYEK